MSARLPSRWLFAAALLAAEGLTSAAMAQSPHCPAGPPVNPAPQAAPVPWLVPAPPPRLPAEPLLLEEEQVSEHGEHRYAAPPAMPSPPRVLRSCGLPECDNDDGKMSAGEMTLRCLLFTIHPLAAFLPLEVEIDREVPPPDYLEHPPQYYPSDCPIPPKCATATTIPEPISMPKEVECLDVMPVEVEQLDVMPVEEESEPEYQLLEPWTDSARLFHLPAWPLAELKVSVQEAETGSLLFGVGAELSRTGSLVFSAEPLAAPKAETAACVCAAAPPQVMLNVLIAEVKATAARKLNLDRSGDGQAPRWVIEVADQTRQKSLEAGLKGLRDKGRAKVLAEPRLVTLSGQQASFFSGGEQAIAVPAGAGEVGVRFEEFGTRIDFQPVVLAGRVIRLEVEPEVSELCEVAGATEKGVIVPGRSSQRVRTTADVARGHTLVITGPKAGGDTRLVVFVTPTVVEPPAATPAVMPQLIFEFGKAVRINSGVNNGEETVHDLLVKCQRELSRGHYAAAEDLAQRAIERDRTQVMSDPVVCGSDLLVRVKENACLPLGTVDPCEAKAAGTGLLSAGEAKAIGSRERMVEALMQEFNGAFKEGRYRDAEALASRAFDLDSQNAAVAAALSVVRTQRQARSGENPVHEVPQPTDAIVRFHDDFKAARYEEAKLDALRVLAASPGNPVALVALQQACEALARQPRPGPVPQCTYVGTNLRPALPRTDPAVVNALQKILIESEMVGPLGGAEEAEPHEDNARPMPRR